MRLRKTTIWVLSIIVLAAIGVSMALWYRFKKESDSATRTLYGKVIDQIGRPVAGANLEFNASVMTGFGDHDYRRWTIHTTSAANGSFSIYVGEAMSVRCQIAARSGYSVASMPGPFAFGGWTSVTYRPDPNHPVLFIMWNDAFRHVFSGKIKAQIDAGNTYICDYVPETLQNHFTGTDDVAFTLNYPKSRPTGVFEWSLEIHAVDGSVMACDGPLGGRAPSEGYVPKLTYVIKPEDQHWSGTMIRRFYTKEQGGSVYAAVELTIKLDPNGGRATASLQYTASFDHSPDLTTGPLHPDKVKPVGSD